MKEQIFWAIRVGLLIAGVVSALVIGVLATTIPVVARCPDGDVECQWWTKVDQFHKNQNAYLRMQIQIARPGLQLEKCDFQCVLLYDKTGHGVLGEIINKYPYLDYQNLVKAYIAYWDYRATAADAMGLPWNHESVFASWLNDFATALQIEKPYVIFDDDSICLRAFYGGICPGKW